MELVYALLIILIIVCVIAIFYIYYYNKIQDYKTNIEKSESIIDEELRNKFDAIKEIKSILDKEVKNKIEFKDIDNLKDMKLSNFDMDRKLDEYTNLINKVIDDYPKVTSNDNYLENYRNLKTADEKITAAKKYYNDNISDFNSLIRKFPSNIIAKFHNIEIKTFFDNKDMNDSDIFDFKL